MPLLDPLHPLQSAVLELLASQGLTTNELHRKLSDKYSLTVSRQNLYRLVGQLVDTQVLVKKKNVLCLNLVWLANLKSFLERADRLYSKGATSSLLPHKEKEVITFPAESLRKLDPIWSDLLLELTKKSSDKHWYGYNARPWYPLGMRDTETRFYQGLIAKGVRITMVYGNTTFLDTYGAGLLKSPGLKVKVAACPFLPRDGYTVWTVDNYVVECVYPQAITRQFNFFFDNVRTLEDFDIAQFSDIFRMRASCAVSITKDRRKAGKVRDLLREL